MSPGRKERERGPGGNEVGRARVSLLFPCCVMLLCSIWRFGDKSKVCFAPFMLRIGSFLQCAMAENSVKFCLVHLVRYSKIFRASGLFFCTTLFSPLFFFRSLSLADILSSLDRTWTLFGRFSPSFRFPT